MLSTSTTMAIKKLNEAILKTPLIKQIAVISTGIAPTNSCSEKLLKFQAYNFTQKE